jgi:hypothetical protein
MLNVDVEFVASWKVLKRNAHLVMPYNSTSGRSYRNVSWRPFYMRLVYLYAMEFVRMVA